MAQALPFFAQVPVPPGCDRIKPRIVHDTAAQLTIDFRHLAPAILICGALLGALMVPVHAWAQVQTADPIAPINDEAAEPPVLTLKLEGSDGVAGMDSALKIVLLMTVLSLAPAFLVLLTSFTRIVIVLGFLRQAIGANQAPSNQIIIGLALFLTVVV